MTKFNLVLASILIFFLVGCGNESENIDSQLSGLIDENNLTGDPSEGRDIPSISSDKAQLGMKLFFTKSLGGDLDSACVTCHHPMLGGGDNLSMSIGVGAISPELLGEGRVHDALSEGHDNGYAPVPRNAPSTFNVALWDKILFWDGRVESLDPEVGENGEVGGIRTPDSSFGFEDYYAGANLAVAQARFPVTSNEEMRGFTFEAAQSNEEVRTHLAQRLNDDTKLDYIANTWESEFQSVYGANQITFATIADAIGEYERSQLFINTPWKAYVEGDVNALGEDAKRGAKLFFSSYENGGMNCVACHSGDFFTDEDFHVMAIPQVGRGKGDGVDDDYGRMRENSVATQKYAFRTPTLLNVEMTGPWGHDGAYTSLKAVVEHMTDPDTAVRGYDFSQLDAMVKTTNTLANTQNALDQLNANRDAGVSPHKSTLATAGQIDDLVAFLESLTDPCVKDRACMGQWIPENVSGVDSLQLNALDQDSNLL